MNLRPNCCQRTLISVQVVDYAGVDRQYDDCLSRRHCVLYDADDGPHSHYRGR